MSSGYSLLQVKYDPLVTGIMERLAKPSEEFYRDNFLRLFSSESYGSLKVFNVKIPGFQWLYYERKDFGEGGLRDGGGGIGWDCEGKMFFFHDVRHVLGILDKSNFEYLEDRNQLLGREDKKDLFGERELNILDDFSRRVEREWKKLSPI